MLQNKAIERDRIEAIGLWVPTRHSDIFYNSDNSNILHHTVFTYNITSGKLERPQCCIMSGLMMEHNSWECRTIELMGHSLWAVCRCLGEKRHVDDTEMTRRGVPHAFKLDPLGRASTWPRSVIPTHLTQVYANEEPGNAAVGCCHNLSDPRQLLWLSLRTQKGCESCFVLSWIN